METHVSIRGLSVHYGGHHVIKGLDAEIPRKQITVIMGPSGCGKTTLLKSINRLLELTEGVRVSGQVFVDGADVYGPGVDVEEVRRHAGLLSQRPFPLPMSIYDNVAYGRRIHRIRGGRTMDEAVQHYLEMAGLWLEVKDRLRSPASRLSVGQQQRLCLARGLAVEPMLILGDEPTSALDPISAQGIERRLVELKRDYTVVLVTHILRQARRLADHVIFMYMGELVEAGPAAEVFWNPREERTRAYISGAF